MAEISKGARIGGYVLTGLTSLFLLADGVGKIVKPRVVVETTVKLGYAESVILPIGIVLIICTLLYLLPASTVLGAILVTGYLGGAVATNVRADAGVFPIVFPFIIGAMLWGGLYLRDARLRAMLPLTS
jgi:hypothetical protein